METNKSHSALNRWLKWPRLVSPECLLLLVALFSRLLPHAPNFTAVGAVALFAGYFFPRREQAIAVPLVAMILSDIVIGFHSSMPWVYAALALTALLGRRLQTAPNLQFSWGRLSLQSLVSAGLFFVVTNFGVWSMGGLYPRNLEGLLSCFVAAIPFFGNTLVSQIVFGGLLFGAHRALRKSGAATQSQATLFRPAP
jgi:hypothetical protein